MQVARTVGLLASAAPPIHAHAPHLATWLFTVWASAVSVAFLPWAIVRLVRRRDPFPVLIMISGALASLNEPLLDHLGHLWYPTDLPITVFTNFGVHIPLLVVPGYVFAAGVAVYVTARLLDRGPSVSGVVRLWLALAGVDLALEYPGVFKHVYVYYGHQPFELFRFPWWWAAVNATAMLTNAFLLWWLTTRLRGRARILVLGVAPTGIMAGYAVTAWPTFLAINADLPPFAQWLAATATVLLGVLAAWVLGIGLNASRGRASAGGQPAPRPADADLVLTKESG